MAKKRPQMPGNMGNMMKQVQKNAGTDAKSTRRY